VLGVASTQTGAVARPQSTPFDGHVPMPGTLRAKGRLARCDPLSLRRDAGEVWWLEGAIGPIDNSLILISCESRIESEKQMAETPIPPEQEARQLKVKLASDHLDHLQRILRPALGLPYDAETAREVISRLRTWFRLPAHVCSVLKKDADSRELHLVTYLQMLLHRRYEELSEGAGHDDRRAGARASEGGAS
jgi:hypothetical protein